jgi:hypothetical protein
MARSYALASIAAAFAGVVDAQDRCDELLASFVSHNPLWQFRSEISSQGTVFVCSFAEDPRWGEDPTAAWTAKCVEEAKRHIACGNSGQIKSVSAPERSRADDGVTYHVIKVLAGVA